MKRLVTTALLCAFNLCILAVTAEAGDKKKREDKKDQPAKKVEKEAPKREPKKVDPRKRAEEVRKQFEDRKKELEAAAKKRKEEQAKRIAESRKKFEEQKKKREAEYALIKRRSQLPRLVQDLVEDRQIAEIEILQERLQSALEAKYSEQKELHERGKEIREEINELRDKFNKDIVKVLTADQQKQLAKRQAEIEAKQKAYVDKREAQRKAALKKLEEARKKD